MYTEKMKSILGKNIYLSCPISRVEKVRNGGSPKYELFKGSKDSSESVGIFDDVVFACHTPEAIDMLKEHGKCDAELLKELGNIHYVDKVVYIHSDTSLMPKKRTAWAEWNCIGKSEHLESRHLFGSKGSGESMEGGESGFGSKLHDHNPQSSQGGNRRMKDMYVTYHLNHLQEIRCEDEILLSMDPHHEPAENLVYEKQIIRYPQLTRKTHLLREKIARDFQGKSGLWFCDTWQDDDSCRIGFEVAMSIIDVPLPWRSSTELTTMILPPPTFVESSAKFISKLCHFVTNTFPVAICKWMVLRFMESAIKKGLLQLEMNDGSIISFGDGSKCGCDKMPVTLRIYDDWFFVKIAMEYDLGLARSYMSGYFNVLPLKDPSSYDEVIKPSHLREESNLVIGDPVGLTRLFYLFIGNRDAVSEFTPKRSIKIYNNALSNAAGLMIARIGAFLNFLRYKLTMDNSEKGGSLKNIHAHYGMFRF